MMKKVKWVLPWLFLLLCTGCYNYRELNQIALTSAIGIDKADDGEGYTVTVQVLNTQKQGSDSNYSGSQPKFILYEQTGPTLQHALRTIILESPRRLYVNHINLLVISETVAKDGIKEILDFFARNTEFRKDFLVVISREASTEDVMQILTPLETLNSKNIHDSIMADAKFYGMATKVTFEDLLNTYLNQRTNIVLPSVEVVGNTKKGEGEDNIKQSVPDATVKLTPLAIFSGEKMMDYLTEEESRIYNYVQNNIQNTIVTTDCSENGKFTAELISTKTKLKPDIENKKISIQVKATASIKEINCNMNLLSPDSIQLLENKINTEIEETIEKDIIKIIQTYKTDIFGFEELLYKSNPNTYKQLKEKYGEELIENFKFEVSSKVKLQTKGNIVKEITR